MRSRLSIWLNELTLDEILHLEEELTRRKEKHRRTFAVLSLQTDRRVLCAAHLTELHFLEREIRRFVFIGAAVETVPQSPFLRRRASFCSTACRRRAVPASGLSPG